MAERSSLLHRDDGLASTSSLGEKLADLETRVVKRFVTHPGNVLDLGCGRGRATVYFALHGTGAVGVDIDLPTLKHAEELRNENSADCEFVRSDVRRLCFRDESFDTVVSFGSTLSEKYRLWLGKLERASIISEAIRVVKPCRTVVVNFVGRYCNLRGSLAFLKHYFAWVWEELTRKQTEFGDYIELIDETPVRFHAFTIREARRLFPRKNIRLKIWRKTGGLFTDWFFIVGRKTTD